MRVFTKLDPGRPEAIRIEAAGLRWLAEAMPAGGTPVVPVVAEREGEMDVAWVPDGHPSALAAEEFGSTLAVTHAAGAPSFGCPPAGWVGDGVMGRMRLPLRAAPTGGDSVSSSADSSGGSSGGGSAAVSWGEFFADDRIGPCLPAARRNGSLTAADCAVVERVLRQLRDGVWDAPQPGLVAGPVARIHGDLWCGNVLWARRESIPWAEPLPECCTADTVGVLIDPAAQGGHAETDLAFLGVFGQPFLREIYAGYNRVSPLAPGWEERRLVHQLYLLAVHAAIFGGSYGGETVRMASRILE